LHIDDATAFLGDFLRRPRPSSGYSSYGYEIYLPNVVVAYLTEVEASVMKIYEAAHGRRKIIEGIVGQARIAIAGPFRSATGLLTYWRDDAAHGLTSDISEIEAHEALSRLLRFAQFANDNWTELTAVAGLTAR
jgi:hypothetical protein